MEGAILNSCASIAGMSVLRCILSYIIGALGSVLIGAVLQKTR